MPFALRIGVMGSKCRSHVGSLFRWGSQFADLSTANSASNPRRRWNRSSAAEFTTKVSPSMVRQVNPSCNHSRRSGCPGSRDSTLLGVQRKAVRKMAPFNEGRGWYGFAPHTLSSQASPCPCHPMWRTPCASSKMVIRPMMCSIPSTSSSSEEAAQRSVASSRREKVPLRNPCATSQPSARNSKLSPAHAFPNSVLRWLRANGSGSHSEGRWCRAGWSNCSKGRRQVPSSKIGRDAGASAALWIIMAMSLFLAFAGHM